MSLIIIVGLMGLWFFTRSPWFFQPMCRLPWWFHYSHGTYPRIRPSPHTLLWHEDGRAIATSGDAHHRLSSYDVEVHLHGRRITVDYLSFDHAECDLVHQHITARGCPPTVFRRAIPLPDVCPWMVITRRTWTLPSLPLYPTRHGQWTAAARAAAGKPVVMTTLGGLPLPTQVDDGSGMVVAPVLLDDHRWVPLSQEDAWTWLREQGPTNHSLMLLSDDPEVEWWWVPHQFLHGFRCLSPTTLETVVLWGVGEWESALRSWVLQRARQQRTWVTWKAWLVGVMVDVADVFDEWRAEEERVWWYTMWWDTQPYWPADRVLLVDPISWEKERQREDGRG